MIRRAIEKQWNDLARETLAGHRIVSASYMEEADAKALGWFHRPLVLTLDDGSTIFAASDDEGNGAGALHGFDGNDRERVFPVL